MSVVYSARASGVGKLVGGERWRYKELVDEPDMNVGSTGLVILATIESLMNKRCKLLNRLTESGGDEACKIEESGAETLPLPLVLGRDTLAACRSAGARHVGRM